jgi:hypothetical protein
MNEKLTVSSTRKEILSFLNGETTEQQLLEKSPIESLFDEIIAAVGKSKRCALGCGYM